MKYYQLPQSDLDTSQIALGCMRITERTQSEIDSLIRGALDLGVNFFDHADIYAGGESENVFGNVIQRETSLREKMLIQSKCSIIPGVCYDMSKEHILRSVDKSLERLKTDYLDTFLIHRPDALCEPEEVAEAFEQLEKSGKVRYFGVSNHNSGQIELLKKYLTQPLMINQLQFGPAHTSMIDQGINANMQTPFAVDYDGDILNYCRLHDITIQPWSTIRATLDEPSFLENPNFPQLNKVLAELADRYNVTKSAIVMAWILRHPAHMQPIAGTTSLKHLQEICNAVEIELTREEWYQLYLANNRPLP